MIIPNIWEMKNVPNHQSGMHIAAKKLLLQTPDVPVNVVKPEQHRTKAH